MRIANHWTPRGFFLLAAALLLLPIRSAAADEPIVWLTGDKLRAQLEQKIGVDWGGTKGLTLRQAVTSLARSQKVAILLDRRVDPDQKIELSVADETLDAVFKLIADKKKIGVGQVGSAIYLGPTATAEKIRTLAALRHEEVLRLPSAERSRILRLRPQRWSDLATPRDLLAALAAETQIEIQGTEAIPHDLWAAADLPPANFVNRLTLIAGQFGLTFAFAEDGKSVRLVAIPATVVIEQTYPLRNGLSQRGAEIVKKLTDSLPGAKIEATANKLIVRGRAEDQDFVDSYLSGRPAKQTTVTPGKKVYQLTTSKPVGPLIEALGKKLDLEVKIDADAIKAAGLSLSKDVKVKVHDVSEDELLKAVLEPAGLTFVRRGKTIEVKPAKKYARREEARDLVAAVLAALSCRRSASERVRMLRLTARGADSPSSRS